MKTPTQTILILLLLAGGLAGFGQAQGYSISKAIEADNANQKNDEKAKYKLNNSNGYFNNQIFSREAVWIGIGLYYQTGKYYGRLASYLTHFNAASMLNVHGFYKKIYFSGTLLSYGGANVKDYIYTEELKSHATHFTKTFNLDLAVGYQIINKKTIGISPYFVYNWQINKIKKHRELFESQSLAFANHKGPGIGANLDIIYLRDDYAEYAVRFKYEISFSNNNSNTHNIQGTIQQIGIGLIVTWIDL